MQKQKQANSKYIFHVSFMNWKSIRSLTDELMSYILEGHLFFFFFIEGIFL